MARATFRQRPPTRGIGRPLLTAAAARSFYNNPNRWGSMSPPSQPIRLPAKPGRPVPLRFLETTDSLRIVAGAASGALGQSHTGLLRRAVRAVELWWNLQVRSCKPDPLAADIVHVREDRRNGADVVFAGRFGCRRSGTPGGRVKMFDKNLVDAIVGEKDPGGKVLDCGSAELSVNLGLTRGHGSLLLDL